MKRFIILSFIFTFFASSLYSKIFIVNECENDIYCANGIATSICQATLAKDKLMDYFELSYPNSYKSVANWKVSLNHTQGIGMDLYESVLQKIYNIVLFFV